MAIRFRCDVMIDKELPLLLSVDPFGYGTDRMFFRSCESMAEGDIAIRCDAHKSKPSSAAVCLTHTFMDLFKRVLHVREAVVFITQGAFKPLVCKLLKLTEHVVLALISDRVVSVLLCGHWCQAHFPKAYFLSEMPENINYVYTLLSQCDPSPDRSCSVDLEQLLYLGLDYIVRAWTVMKDAQTILDRFRSVDRDCHTDLVIREPLDDLGC